MKKRTLMKKYVTDQNQLSLHPHLIWCMMLSESLRITEHEAININVRLIKKRGIDIYGNVAYNCTDFGNIEQNSYAIRLQNSCYLPYT